MAAFKRIVGWCIRHTTAKSRKPRLLDRLRGRSIDIEFDMASISSSLASTDTERLSSETLVCKSRTRAFSEPAYVRENQYSYCPVTEDERQVLVSRSPPPTGPRRYMFPAFVEMGGLMEI
ncbi:hypothetical protein FBU59_002845 [Linderina macrospora]|uniref:Uncharacterized protein n=1 Tax=Linderina macrospora TaxID=4868 RepID=A0ACC1J9X6_9FUNG|nr:hypothetical protein FBU59_002845 [Linderina macrospora]